MNNILRRTILAGLFIIPFFSFFISTSLLFPFIAGKNFAFRIVVEIVFVLWTILAIRDKEYLPQRSWILYTYAAFMVVISIADIFGADFTRSFWSNFERMEGLVAHIHFFLYFIVISSMFTTRKVWDYFFATWVGAGTLMSLYGLFQLAGKITINQGGVRVDGTFGNAIYLAVFLLFTLFFTGIFVVRSIKNEKNHLWYLIPVAFLQLYVLYATATRGVILGLIGGVIVMASVLVVRERQNKTIRNSAIGLLVGVVLIAGIFISIRNTAFVQHSPVLSRFATLSVKDLQTQGRYFIWPMAIKGFTEKPILGWGEENFGIVFSKYYNAKMYNQEQWFDRAHSAPLDWLIAGGFFGFITYISLFVSLFWYLWKKNGFHLSFAERGLLLGLGAAYFFQALFVFDNLYSYILFFTLLAFTHVQSDGKRMNPSKIFVDDSIKNPMIAVVIIVGLLCFYFWNMKPISAGQTLIDGMKAVGEGRYSQSLDSFESVFTMNTFGSGEAREQLVNSSQNFLGTQVPQDIKVRYANLAKRELELQVAHNPNDARSHVFYGTLLQNLGIGDASIAEFKKAAELSPTKQTILFQLGGAYISMKNTKDALDTFKKAYAIEPENREAVLLLGIAGVYASDTEIANKAFAQVDPLTLLFDDRLVSALASTNHYEELVNIFTKRLSLDQGKSNPQNYISLAYVYSQTGQKISAIQVLEALAVQNPSYKDQVAAYIKQLQGN